jgi:hypothetical protein
MKISFALFLISCERLRANAQESFYRVYQYETPLKGHLELEKWVTTIIKSDLPYQHFGETLRRKGLWAYSTEAEYGVTDHLSVAAYANFEDPKGDRLHYTESRIEARYRLAQRYQYFVNTALYFEYYIPNHSYSNSNQIEARLILDKDVNDFRLVLNPTASKYVNGDEDKSWQPAIDGGLYYRRGKVLQPGVEYYTNFHEKTANIFPTLNINIGGHVVWQLGAGFGLNNKSDKLTAKTILQIDLQAIRPTRLMR